jgi:hypothetical protein
VAVKKIAKYTAVVWMTGNKRNRGFFTFTNLVRCNVCEARRWRERRGEERDEDN